MGANALADGRAGSERPGSGRFRLAHAANWQSTKNGERAAGKTGFAQETAAVETTSLTRKGLRDGTVA